MNYQDWYIPETEKQRNRLHYEIMPVIRPKLVALLGEKRKDRHINIGKIGPLKKELRAKFKQDNPEWDFYHSVQYVAKTIQVNRDTFKQKIDDGYTHQEIAQQIGTHQEIVKEKHEKLEKNRLPNEFSVPVDFTKKWEEKLYETPAFDIPIDIDGDHVLSQRHNLSKEEVKQEYEWQEIIQAAYEEAQKVVNYYNKLNVPYSIRFSGGKGFHIVIPRNKLEKYIDNTTYSQYTKHWPDFIKEKTGATVDRSIYKNKQIIRTPYTMHTETQMICMPLTRQQFQNFELKYASPDYIRNNIDMYQRGLKVRDGNAADLLLEYQEYTDKIDVTSQNQTSRDTNQRKVQKHVKQLQQLDPETRKQVINEVKNQ